MGTTTQSDACPSLIVSPPYVVAPDIGVVALDVTFGLFPGSRGRGMPLVCMGGHPASECLLDPEGSGRSHEITVAVDQTSLPDRRLVERVRSLLSPSVPLQVVAHTMKARNDEK